MKDIVILSLSDLHIKEEGEDRNAEKIREAFLKNIPEIIRDKGIKWKPDFICISGDITFSGKQKEYEVAGKFLDNLSKTFNLDRKQVIMTPGNHDITITKKGKNGASYPLNVDPHSSNYIKFVSKYLKEVSLLLEKDEINKDSEISKAYKNYSNFRSRFIDEASEEEYVGIDLFKEVDIPYLSGLRVCKENKIVFLEINNSWRWLPEIKKMSPLRKPRFILLYLLQKLFGIKNCNPDEEIEKAYSINFGKHIIMRFIEIVKKYRDDHFLIVGLFHHPLLALDPMEYQSSTTDYCLYDDLFSHLDICFAGHSHGPEYKHPDCIGNDCQLILNGSFYDSHPDSENKIHRKIKNSDPPDCSALLVKLDVINNSFECMPISRKPRNENWIKYYTLKFDLMRKMEMRGRNKIENDNLRYKLLTRKYLNETAVQENKRIVTEFFNVHEIEEIQDGWLSFITTAPANTFEIFFMKIINDENDEIIRRVIEKVNNKDTGIQYILCVKAIAGFEIKKSEKKFMELKKSLAKSIKSYKILIFMCLIDRSVT